MQTDPRSLKRALAALPTQPNPAGFLDRSAQVQAPDCGAPAGCPDLGGELIFVFVAKIPQSLLVSANQSID